MCYFLHNAHSLILLINRITIFMWVSTCWGKKIIITLIFQPPLQVGEVWGHWIHSEYWNIRRSCWVEFLEIIDSASMYPFVLWLIFVSSWKVYKMDGSLAGSWKYKNKSDTLRTRDSELERCLIPHNMIKLACQPWTAYVELLYVRGKWIPPF